MKIDDRFGVAGRDYRPVILLFHQNSEELSRWQRSLRGACQVRAIASTRDLEEVLEHETVDAVVSEWPEHLLENVPALRKGVRIIHCGSSIPDSVIDAAAQGYNVAHIERVEQLRGRIGSLTRGRRSVFVRQELNGLRVTYAGSSSSYELLEISNDGLSFCVRGDQEIEPLLPRATLEDVRLISGSTVALDGVRATVRHVALAPEAGANYRVGCELRPTSAFSPAVARNVIRDRVQCLGLLRSALRRGGILLQSADESALGVQCIEGHVDPRSNELRLSLEDHSFAKYDPVTGRFEVAGSIYRFSTVVVSSSPLRLRLPVFLEETHMRTSARYQPPSTASLAVEFSSPLLAVPIIRSIRDLSGTGCAFEIDPLTDVFPPGLRFTEIRLRARDCEICFKGRVKNLVRVPERPRSLRCGVEFEGLDPSSRLQLADLIMRGRFPTLEDGRSVSFQTLWQFFVETNFMYAEKQKVLAPVFPALQQTLDGLNATPNNVFKSLVSKRGERILGYVSGLRAYRNTWLSQHLAATPGGQLGSLLNIGLAEYFGQDTDLEYCKVYFRPENRWPARIFGSFARKVSDRHLSDLRTFAYFTIPTELNEAAAPRPLKVVEAKGQELSVVERFFVAKEPALILRSDDLTRAGLELNELNASYRELGLERRRCVLLALWKDSLVAFALAEISSPGLNLSELLSAFRIYLLEPGMATEAYSALLRAAARLYREAGRPFAVALAASDQVAHFEREGFKMKKQYACWTCDRTLYLRFGEHVEHVVNTFLERQRRRSNRLGLQDARATTVGITPNA